MCGCFAEVALDGFANVDAQFLDGFCLGVDAEVEGAGRVPAVNVIFADLKDDPRDLRRLIHASGDGSGAAGDEGVEAVGADASGHSDQRGILRSPDQVLLHGLE
ncbi:hypothetical protein [Candidatus Poriferisodalis sp.]|uniref:hypothetical protein n=1 Tax=Candidatus Poriferisodalis sp. TaxID=3101277 RepID=UPI003B59B3C6